MLFLAELEQSISRLKGIGPKAQKDLAQLGIQNIGQLLRHFPNRYENRKDLVSIAQSHAELPVNSMVRVGSSEWIGHGRKKTLKVWVSDSSGSLALVCFGRNFLEQKLTPGKEIHLFAKVQVKFSEKQASWFEFEEPGVENSDFGAILPIYPLSGNLQQKTLRKAQRQALNEWLLHIEEELPQALAEQYGFPQQKDIIHRIHFPQSMEQAEGCRRALVYQEWFHLQLSAGRRWLKSRKPRDRQLKLSEASLEAALKELPFELTQDQNSCLHTIKDDLSSPYPMNRLVQGEVGSGKTLVAFLSAHLVIEAQGQAAFMAPTELLARQHFQNAQKLLPQYRLALLTGQTPDGERQQILEHLKSGQLDFLIGTHALFSEDVEYQRLDLVIVDEQHRFGVRQRLSLVSKGDHPHLLLMTATPIPRTLAITAFGDLEISSIKTMPKGRKPIVTHLAQHGKETKVYDFVHGELQKGRQAYFVYPLIEESEKMDLKDAQSMFELLSTQVFPQYKCALIHSRLKEEEKTSSMEAFVKGRIQILIATSVVEVGVDVPNATIMVVEQAERFGLSALHQLRGRVGRGEWASYCFLVYSPRLSDEGKQRMRYMMDIASGFEIAQKDLELRGPGDITGFRQSGFMRLRIAQLGMDQDIMEQAQADVKTLLKEDPGLIQEDNRVLKELFQRVPPFNDQLIARG